MFRRKRFIFFFLLALLAVSGFLLWNLSDEKNKEKPRASRVSNYNEHERPTPTHTTPNSAAGISTPSFATQGKLFIEAFKTPIRFYGKVIDQDGAPVSQADIKLSANDKPLGGRPSEYSLKSDVAGLFSIENIAGLNLAVEVSKPGFRVIPRSHGNVTSSGLFEYSVSSSSIRGPHIANKESPVPFMLYRPGVTEDLIKVGEKNFRIARDGAPLKISLDQGSGESHQVVLRCWNQDLGRSAGQRQYDWRLEIRVPNGGLLNRTENFAFEAPDGGYLSTETINMPATLPAGQWHGFAKRSYFIRFDDGIFARANLEMRAGGDHFVVWESFLNPTPGSRNLEYDPNRRVNQ
jgi:hypothetical protein